MNKFPLKFAFVGQDINIQTSFFIKMDVIALGIMFIMKLSRHTDTVEMKAQQPSCQGTAVERLNKQNQKIPGSPTDWAIFKMGGQLGARVQDHKSWLSTKNRVQERYICCDEAGWMVVGSNSSD